MYPSQHNIYTLSSKDIGQLKLYYYVYRGVLNEKMALYISFYVFFMPFCWLHAIRQIYY